MGKPVVSTPIEELKAFPTFVKIGNTAEEWEKHIKTLAQILPTRTKKTCRR